MKGKMSSTIPLRKLLFRRPNLLFLRVLVIVCVFLCFSTVFITSIETGAATREEEPTPSWSFSTNIRLEAGSVNNISRRSSNNVDVPSCYFEDANGYYHNQKDDVNNITRWTWNWIHNESLSSSSSDASDKKSPQSQKQSQRQQRRHSPCIITNHLQAIREKRYRPSHPLVFLTLGDSLDRNIVMDHICAKWDGFYVVDGGTQRSNIIHHKQNDNSSALVLNNTAPNKRFTSGICTNHESPVCCSFAFFKIYGMHHDCENNGMLRKEDSRITHSTADRVTRFLKPDILFRLWKVYYEEEEDPSSYRHRPNVVVLVGSSLWDLSAGEDCNNNNNGVTISPRYQALYRQGIIRLHQALRAQLSDRKYYSSIIYWRTSPAVSQEYDEMAKWQKWGRNRANQETLNTILRETVAQEGLGVVVDWWHQANQRPESERGINRDGRHYEMEPSLAFYNLFLNAVFDHHPWLLE